MATKAIFRRFVQRNEIDAVRNERFDKPVARCDVFGMSKKTEQDQVLLDEVENKIYVIRGERVMLPPAMRTGVSALRYEMKLSPTEIFKGKTIFFIGGLERGHYCPHECRFGTNGHAI